MLELMLLIIQGLLRHPSLKIFQIRSTLKAQTCSKIYYFSGVNLPSDLVKHVDESTSFQSSRISA